MTEVVAGAPTTRGRSAEFWGYLMWGLAGLAILVPELVAVFAVADWPTISATIGHLETRHDWVRLIVVFVIVVLAYYAVPQLAKDPQTPCVVHGRQVTANGRLTANVAEVGYQGMGGYLVFALAAFAFGVVFAAGARAVDSDSYAGGYVLYGIIAVVWVILPSVLAMFFAREVPFPTLFRTLAYLGRRAHWLAAVVLALLVILLIHLAFYPWPQLDY
ncbi:hypothetical protein [Nocardia pseudobrasiliensis]|uniref:Uncharacterized protein n=1 Tax=Nocardia pseudobrasiliensis TaxID=45979 RepID=A0A370I7E1_9NOCA|nr:hypothetical protein [Nocardia pseudobrasiliensis]RDI66550.1 hypothetical protein DFR76_104300 [Nocardia pseudobrasiliensis]